MGIISLKSNRIQNAKRNIMAGLFNSLVLTILPFALRTVFAHTLGIEYLGLNSLFSSVLTILNLTELGVGSALVFNMYQPASIKNFEQVNSLLVLYRKIYSIIGILIFFIGFWMLPVLPFLVNGEAPADINITLLFVIYLFNTSISYLGYAYRKSILIAFQRQDIISNINSGISTCLYIFQIVILFLLKNYYAYIILIPLFTIIENFIEAYYSKKLFPQVYPVGEVDAVTKKKIRDHVKGIALQKICTASRNAFDSIAISMFLGLVSTATYNNYYYIMSSVHSFLYQIPNAIRSSVGNSVAVESEEQNFLLFSKMNLLYVWISGWATVCFICLFQPFMILWMGKDLLLPFHTVILISLYFFELSIGDMIALYKDAVGLWWHGRYRTIIEAVANLILNFVFGYLWGIDGIILATIITIFFLGIVYGGYIVFKYYFKSQKFGKYLITQGGYFIIIVLSAIITYILVCYINADGLYGIILRLIASTIISNIIIVLFFRKDKLFVDALSLLKRTLKFDF